VDENGRFYFILDGSGTPFEVRIDLPLEAFQGLAFDGAPWAPAQYGVRSGSTVLTVAAARLAQYPAGLHTLTASFAEETVDIVFDLRKPEEENEAAPAPSAGTLGPSAPAPVYETGPPAPLEAPALLEDAAPKPNPPTGDPSDRPVPAFPAFPAGPAFPASFKIR
jgi:hypothetical protein